MEEIIDIDITILVNPGSDNISLAESSQIPITFSTYTQNTPLELTITGPPSQSTFSTNDANGCIPPIQSRTLTDAVTEGPAEVTTTTTPPFTNSVTASAHIQSSRNGSYESILRNGYPTSSIKVSTPQPSMSWLNASAHIQSPSNGSNGSVWGSGYPTPSMQADTFSGTGGRIGFGVSIYLIVALLYAIRNLA